MPDTPTNAPQKKHGSTIQDALIDNFLFLWGFLTLLGFIGILYRSIDIGWTVKEYIISILTLGIFFTFFFRHRISTIVKANILILFNLIIAFVGFYLLGMVSGAVFFFSTYALIVAIFYSRRAIISFAVLTLIYLLAIAYMYSNGTVFYTDDINTYISSFSHWLLYIIAIFYCYIAISIAIYRYKRVTEELVSEARHANDAKSEFLSILSHDFRNTLGAITGYSHLIKQKLPQDIDPKTHNDLVRFLNVINNAGDFMLTMTNDLLDLAKIEAGKIELSIKEYKLGDILSECLPIIEHAADEHDIQIQNKIDKGADIAINVDEMRFKQILLNLLSNAVKYNKEHGKIIIECSTNDPHMLRLTISDTGIGIDPEQQQNLFQPFARAGAEKSNIKGTGLGLMISKQLTEMMGGAIGVNSEKTRGSEFWIEVPLYQQDQ